MKKEETTNLLSEKESQQEKLRKQSEIMFYPAFQLFKQFKQLTNSSQIDSIISSFAQVAFFQKVCPEDCPINDFIRNALPFFRYESSSRGQPIFHYGDPAERFYVILRGRLGVYVRRDEEHIQQDLQQVPTHTGLSFKEFWGHMKDHQKLNDDLLLLEYNNNQTYFDGLVPKFSKVFEFFAGQTFGEVALTNDSPRTATIITISEEISMISMSKHDFKKILVSKALNEKLDYFRRFFDDVGKFTLAKFIQYFHEIQFNPQTLLWLQGDSPQFFFIIRTGRVEIFQEQETKCNEISLRAAKKTRKKQTIATLSTDMFVGEDELLDTKQTRQYSCKTLEVTSALYITAENFNSIKKIFPQIIKSLKEKCLLKQNWFLQRQKSLKQNQEQLDKQFEENNHHQVVVQERRTVDQPQRPQTSNGLRSKIPQHLPHNVITLKNEEIHAILIKRNGESAKNDFMMMQKDALEQIQIRVNQRYKKAIVQNHLQRSRTMEIQMLTDNLKKKNSRRSNRAFQIQQSSDSFQVTLNTSRIDSSKKAGAILLTRNFNPDMQHKERLVSSITNTPNMMTLEDQIVGLNSVNRIKSGMTDTIHEYQSVKLQQNNSSSSFQFVISPKYIRKFLQKRNKLNSTPKSQMRPKREIKSAINFQFKTSNNTNNIHNMKIKQS